MHFKIFTTSYVVNVFKYCSYCYVILAAFFRKIKFISFSAEGGRCVTFNPTDETMFLVGTDEGLIYKCTTEYSSKYLETYHAHNTPIYNIAWNPYVTSVFLTCAAEWMVKIWDHKAK